MKILITLMIAVTAAPALAAGFNAATLKAAAQTREVAEDRMRERLDAAAESLRLAIALDPAKALAAASPAEGALLKSALTMGDAGGDLRARWFMAGAVGRSYPGAKASVFYNPLARGWLIVTWRAEGERWLIDDATLTAAGPADWIAKPGAYLANFVADYRKTEPVLGEQPGSLAGIEADRWIGGVASWLGNPAKAKAASAARALIVAGHTAKLGGGAIDQIPARARATFWPVGGLRRDDGQGSLIFGSALYPQLLIAADFNGDGQPALVHLTLVNLGAVQ